MSIKRGLLGCAELCIKLFNNSATLEGVFICTRGILTTRSHAVSLQCTLTKLNTIVAIMDETEVCVKPQDSQTRCLSFYLAHFLPLPIHFKARPTTTKNLF